MPNWTESMQRTYEYYEVDPGTWKDVKRLTNVKSSSITRDSSVETLGSATIDVTGTVGECYIRVYLVTIQNGSKERFPLGTYLVQTPSSSYDGKTRNVGLEAYTPLIELKENPPPLGYSLLKGDEIMSKAYTIVREHVRAPVVPPQCGKKLYNDFVAEPNDTWCSFTTDLISNAKYGFDLDEMGRVLFAPNQDTASLQPVWTYTDDNSSILYPELSMDHDLYGIPNAVEVVYSTTGETYYAKVVNDDPNSPTSTVNRGRELLYRVTDLSSIGDPTEKQIDEYAERVLKELSTVEYTVSYTHGYCPVRVGDCIRLNYSRAGLTDIKAKVIYQNIKCNSECVVSEKAVFTRKLWR